MQAVLDCKGADVFFDGTKDMRRFCRLCQLEELDVRVVRMVRDVRGFVASAKNRGRSAQEAATSWTLHHSQANDILAGLPKGRVLTLKYEELCADPTEAMNNVHRFLGVTPFTLPEVVDPCAHHVIGNRMRLRGPIRISLDETWRDTLSRDELEATLCIAHDLNERLGYPTAHNSV